MSEVWWVAEGYVGQQIYEWYMSEIYEIWYIWDMRHMREIYEWGLVSGRGIQRTTDIWVRYMRDKWDMIYMRYEIYE